LKNLIIFLFGLPWLALADEIESTYLFLVAFETE